MPRLGIVTALMAEAVPLIDYYRLRKQPKQPGYHYFTSESIDLIVCGMGPKNMAQGIKAYINQQSKQLPTKWLNLGIAGTDTEPIGILLWATSIEGHEIGHPEITQNQQAINVISLSEPSVDYKPNTLFDMEASAYLKCIQENLPDCSNSDIFCAKVISDNARKNSLIIDKARVTDLIRENLVELKNATQKLIKS